MTTRADDFVDRDVVLGGIIVVLLSSFLIYWFGWLNVAKIIGYTTAGLLLLGLGGRLMGKRSK